MDFKSNNVKLLVSSASIEITAEKKNPIISNFRLQLKKWNASIETVTVAIRGTNIEKMAVYKTTLILYKSSKGDNFTYLSTKGRMDKVKIVNGKTG